jgi:FtsP/CotA-like multicopper oxidase with cupredoxin domain
MTMSIDCLNCPNNTLDCKSSHCIASDGYQRPVRSINRQIPGPGIQVCENDIIVVNLLNKMETWESTTLHFHGFRQKGTPYMVIIMFQIILLIYVVSK